MRLKVAVVTQVKSACGQLSLAMAEAVIGALHNSKYDAVVADLDNYGVVRQGHMDQGNDTSVTGLISGYPSTSLWSYMSGGDRPDVGIVTSRGRPGLEGSVQGLLDLLNIPYLGSGVLSTALVCDRLIARKILDHERIAVPNGIAVLRAAETGDVCSRLERELRFPVIVKPRRGHFDLGATVAGSLSELATAIESTIGYEDLLVEEFIDGTELICCVVGNEMPEALPVVAILADDDFRKGRAMYTANAVTEVVPAPVPPEQYTLAKEIAVKCHRAFGCRDMSSTRMISRGGALCVLGVETHPIILPRSSFVHAAQAARISLPELMDRLIGYAMSGGSWQRSLSHVLHRRDHT